MRMRSLLAPAVGISLLLATGLALTGWINLPLGVACLLAALVWFVCLIPPVGRWLGLRTETTPEPLPAAPAPVNDPRQEATLGLLAQALQEAQTFDLGRGLKAAEEFEVGKRQMVAAAYGRVYA